MDCTKLRPLFVGRHLCALVFITPTPALMNKIGVILIGVLLGAFAMLEICIGHTVGKGIIISAETPLDFGVALASWSPWRHSCFIADSKKEMMMPDQPPAPPTAAANPFPLSRLRFFR